MWNFCGQKVIELWCLLDISGQVSTANACDECETQQITRVFVQAALSACPFLARPLDPNLAVTLAMVGAALRNVTGSSEKGLGLFPRSGVWSFVCLLCVGAAMRRAARILDALLLHQDALSFYTDQSDTPEDLSLPSFFCYVMSCRSIDWM